MKPQTKFFVAATAIAAVAFAAPAEAHVAAPGPGGFGQGFAHPFLGLDHVLAMIAVGLWAAHLGGHSRWLVPATFIAAMGLAGGGAMAGLALPFVETALALTVVALGALIYARARPSLACAVALVAGFAMFHGLAHGAEAPLGAGLGYGLGLMAATALLHGLGLAIGTAAVCGRGAWQARLGGGVAVIAGVLLMVV